MKIVNIHTDKKFIELALKIDILNYESLNILITNEIDNHQSNNIIIHKLSKKNLETVISICNKADLVILWGLESVKMTLIDGMINSVRIIWVLFGAEVYSLHKGTFLEPKSLKYGLIKSNKSFYKRIENFIKKKISRKMVLKKKDIRCYYSRINGFVCAHELEYKLLLKIEPNLPRYIQSPFYENNIVMRILDETISNKIIIGANRQSSNNHIDLFIELVKLKNIGNYNFKILFNYGEISQYSLMVKNIADNRENFDFVEKFIPQEKYNNWLSKNSALVVNSLRQNSMGSIYKALRFGLNVYLNKNGIMYRFLKEDGFIVFKIEDLIEKIKNDENICINNTIAKHNVELYNTIVKKRSMKLFQEDVINIIKKGYSNENY